MNPEYQEALGIATSDLVYLKHAPIYDEGEQEPYYPFGKVSTTYRVWSMTPPRRWVQDHFSISIWPTPVISLILVPPDYNKPYPPRSGFAYFNDIFRRNDRWYQLNGDELIVIRECHNTQFQMGLFYTPNDDPDPYPFQKDVDYTRKDQIWHCDQCGTDFNVIQTEHHNPMHCRVVSQAVYMMDDGDLRNAFQRYLKMPIPTR